MRFRPRQPPPPLLWTLFCDEWLRLDYATLERWWQALERARWSRAVELRTIVLTRAALGQRQGSTPHFVRENLSPQTLIAALEDLVKEGVLPAPVARRLEEAVLAQTHVSGLWKYR